MTSSRSLISSLALVVALQTLAYAKVPPTPVLNNGPGIVVCEPVTKNKDVANFSAGCGLWLEYEVAGQPAFGKSPRWVDLPAAAEEAGHTDLRLTPQDMPNFVRALGPTHVALGTCTGTHQHTRLTYQLYAVSPLRKVGRSIGVVGSEESIVKQLPDVATKLCSELMPGSASISGSVGATPHQLAVMGAVQFDKIAQGLIAPILAMAKTVPLAGVIAVDYGLPYEDDIAELNIANTLLINAPTNPVVLDILDYAVPRPRALAPAIAVALRKHPDNYMIADADYFERVHNLSCPNAFPQRLPLTVETALSLKAIHVARCAPSSPNAQRAIRYYASDQALAIRGCVTWDQLNDRDAAYITKLYSIAYQASHNSVHMDPLCKTSWEDLAEDATFDGDTDVANHAYEVSIKIDPHNASMYSWGLQMFAPKWQDNPSGFARAAALTMKAPVNDFHKIQLAKNLEDAGFTYDSNALLALVKKHDAARLKIHPNDREARADSAEMSVEFGDPAQAAAGALTLEKKNTK